MAVIEPGSNLVQVAAAVSEALEAAGIAATLSGCGAVSIYSDNEYQSADLDFVSVERLKAISEAIAPLGFNRVPQARMFEHADIEWTVEFPAGPLGFGRTTVGDDEVSTIETQFGQIRIITPTQCVMDRLALYYNYQDNQSLDQAVMVAKQQVIDWDAVYAWAESEGIDTDEVDRVRRD